jgi:hypothetical protein
MRLFCSSWLGGLLLTALGCASAPPRARTECKADCRLDVITPRTVRGESNPRFLVRVYDGCNLDVTRLEPMDPASPIAARDGEAGQVVRFEIPVGMPAVLVVADLMTARSSRTPPRFRRFREVTSNRVVVDFNGGSSDEALRQGACR